MWWPFSFVCDYIQVKWNALEAFDGFSETLACKILYVATLKIVKFKY